MPCELSQTPQITCMNKLFSDISTNPKSWAIIFCLFIYIPTDKAYSLDTVSLKQGFTQGILVPNKTDLTKLPLGKIFKVNHSKFTLQFFFNNKDIFGFILKREQNYGIIVRLCFFRSCEESPYDINQVIAMPQSPAKDRSFFSIKYPLGLNYDFQGVEFLPIK